MSASGLPADLCATHADDEQRAQQRLVSTIVTRLESPFDGGQASHAADALYCDVMFERPEVQRIVRGMYAGAGLIVHGPPMAGKSHALCAAMRGRPAVLHLVLRNQCETDGFTDAVAQGLGLGLGAEKLSPHQLMWALKRAMTLYYSRQPSRPILLLIEDLHTCIDRRCERNADGEPLMLHNAAAMLLGDLTEAHRDGRINVLLTVSEASGIQLIHRESGFRHIRAIDFPQIDDRSLEQQLRRLCYEWPKDVSAAKPHFEMLASADTPTPPGKTRLLTSDAAARAIVSTVGSHMGSINQAIEGVVNQQQQQRSTVAACAEDAESDDLSLVTRALDPLVLLEESHLEDVLNVGPSRRTVGQAIPHFEATARRLLSALAALPDGQALDVVDTLLRPSGPFYWRTHALPKDDVRSILNVLVQRKVLSRPTPRTVQFYSRAVQHAYKRFEPRW